MTLPIAFPAKAAARTGALGSGSRAAHPSGCRGLLEPRQLPSRAGETELTLATLAQAAFSSVSGRKSGKNPRPGGLD